MIKEKFKVRRIDPRQTYEWILHKHYAKRLPSISYAFGLFDENNILQGICTFGIPASPSLCKGICGEEYRDVVIELNRLCINDNHPSNVTSFLVSNSLKLLPKYKIVVSYADTGQNHIGYVYQATNWLYTGITKERTDIGPEDGSHSRHYSKDIDYSKNRKIRTAKHRYIYFLGNKSERRKLLKLLKYSRSPYPKGESRKYNANYKPLIQGELF